MYPVGMSKKCAENSNWGINNDFITVTFPKMVSFLFCQEDNFFFMFSYFLSQFNLLHSFLSFPIYIPRHLTGSVGHFMPATLQFLCLSL